MNDLFIPLLCRGVRLTFDTDTNEQGDPEMMRQMDSRPWRQTPRGCAFLPGLAGLSGLEAKPNAGRWLT
ncbi:hypothetical protein GCM10009687_36390 [Asanoa iriomotensis]|uniref:Uncharacterized protein n=1 Tax=Asanoa iriomotensis TaxID=234613 RepID=A0ABQ4CBZ3_9ACTN|nr:hypothetical protein Air01nite_60760 [Asanoa iriomotensis]